MSATSDTNDSMDSELTVYVAALGKAARSDIIRDMDALLQKATSQIGAIARMNSQSVTQVVVRGNWELKEALDAEFSSANDPEVTYTGWDFRLFLDDEGQTYDNGQKEIPPVKESDDAPVAEHVAAVHDITADEFDLTDGEQRRELIGAEVLNRLEDEYEEKAGSRINRAKAKAYGKTDEYVYNDHHDSVPTADAAVFLNDGSDRGMEALDAARGNNPWVKYPEECAGSVMDISVDKDSDHIIDWTKFMLDTNQLEQSDLTDDQFKRLTSEYDSEALERMGVDPDADSASGSLDPDEDVDGSVTPDTEASASGGALQPSDD
jgi:hypothetical protein